MRGSRGCQPVAKRASWGWGYQVRTQVRDNGIRLTMRMRSLCVLLLLSACSPARTPVQNTPIFPTVAMAEPGSGSTVIAEPPAKPKRFLGFLNRKPDPAPVIVAVSPSQDAGAAVAVAPESGPSMSDAEIAAAGRVPGAAEPSRRPRLFSFLNPRIPGDVRTPRATLPVQVAPNEAAEKPAPSMTDAEIAAAGRVPGAAEPSRRPRLFGFLKQRVPGDVIAPAAAPVVLAAAPAPDTDDPITAAPMPLMAAPGLIPFGEVIRVCEVKQRDMGAEVARAHGSGFRLFDADPSSAAPRSQFLTGFKDGCARQFTASLALFGGFDVHEATRYNPLNKAPYSRVDTAYEKVKNRICGVRKGQYCPEKRAAKLEKQTAFVTVYPQFGGTGEWLEIFLYKGQLVTYQTRTN